MKQYIAVGALFLASPALGAGMFVPELGTQAQSRGGAFTAKADDPSALVHNPAGLMSSTGTRLYLGSNFIDYGLRFQRAGRYEPSVFAHGYEGELYPEVQETSSPSPGIGGYQPVPLLVVTSDLGLTLPARFAAGIYAPQGYPNRAFTSKLSGSGADTAPAPQRYDLIEEKVVALLPSLAGAYAVNDWLDVGLRLSWGFMQLESTNALWGVRNFEEAPDKDAVFAVSAKDSFIPAFGLGVRARPLADLEVGLAYASPLIIHAEGIGRPSLGSAVGVAGVQDVIEPVPDAQAKCAPGGRIGAVKACIDLTLPQTLAIGGRWRFMGAERERGDVELDVRWEDWSAGSTYDVTVDAHSGLTGLGMKTTRIKHGFHDAVSIRLGGAANFDVGPGLLEARAGAAYDTAAAPPSWTRVDLDGASRFTLAGGLSYDYTWLRFEAGVGIVLEPDRSVGVCAPPDGPSDTSPGCSGTETPLADRTQPDPSQPLEHDDTQAQSPYNSGTYTSRYTLFTLALTASF